VATVKGTSWSGEKMQEGSSHRTRPGNGKEGEGDRRRDSEMRRSVVGENEMIKWKREGDE
jgi:hypothetical protein